MTQYFRIDRIPPNLDHLGSAVTQAVNSMRRLQATVIGGRDLGIGDGGAASFLDVCRVLWALWSDTESRSKSALVPPGDLPNPKP